MCTLDDDSIINRYIPGAIIIQCRPALHRKKKKITIHEIFSNEIRPGIIVHKLLLMPLNTSILNNDRFHIYFKDQTTC